MPLLTTSSKKLACAPPVTTIRPGVARLFWFVTSPKTSETPAVNVSAPLLSKPALEAERSVAGGDQAGAGTHVAVGDGAAEFDRAAVDVDEAVVGVGAGGAEDFEPLAGGDADLSGGVVGDDAVDPPRTVDQAGVGQAGGVDGRGAAGEMKFAAVGEGGAGADRGIGDIDPRAGGVRDAAVERARSRRIRIARPRRR